MRAHRDSNSVVVGMGASNADGITPIELRADPTTHILDITDGNTGSDNGRNPAVRDENSVPVFMAESNAGDGTLVEIYLDSITNKLLVKST